jgi:hypothetical protein
MLGWALQRYITALVLLFANIYARKGRYACMVGPEEAFFLKNRVQPPRGCNVGVILASAGSNWGWGTVSRTGHT